LCFVWFLRRKFCRSISDGWTDRETDRQTDELIRVGLGNLNTRCAWAGVAYYNIIYSEYKGVSFILHLGTCGTTPQMQSVPFFSCFVRFLRRKCHGFMMDGWTDRQIGRQTDTLIGVGLDNLIRFLQVQVPPD
jgi:hypothetical protein